MRYYNKLPQAKVARAKSRAKKKAALQALTAQLAEAKRELAETLPKLNSSNRAWLREKENREVAESKRDSYKKALEQIRDIEQGCKDRGVGYNEQVYLMAIDALNLK